MGKVFDRYLATQNMLERNRMNAAQLQQMALQDELSRKTMADKVRAAAIANRFNEAQAIGLEGKNRLFGDTYDQQKQALFDESRLRQAQALGLETDAQYAPQRAAADLMHKQAQAQHQQFERDQAQFNRNMKQQQYIGEAARRAREQYPDDPQAQADAVLRMAQRAGGFNEQIINSITPDNMQNLALTPATGTGGQGAKFQRGASFVQTEGGQDYIGSVVYDMSQGGIPKIQRVPVTGLASDLGETAEEQTQRRITEAGRTAAAGATGTGQAKDFLAIANTGVQSADALLNVRRAQLVGKEISQGGLASATEKFKAFFGANDANAAEFLARTTESALLALKPLVGSPATDTDAALVQITTADIRNNGPEANMRLLEKLEKSLNEKITSGINAAQAGSLDPYYESEMMRKKQISEKDPYYAGKREPRFDQVAPSGRMDPANQGLVPQAPTRSNVAQTDDTVRGPDGSTYKVIDPNTLQGMDGKLYTIRNGKLVEK